MATVSTTLEIALLLMLPLILFFQRSSWKWKEYAFLIPIIYVVWYLSYAFLHELSHLSAALLLGKKVYDFQLIPYFWEGQTGVGYVNSEYNPLTVLMPYLKDLVFCLLGSALILKKAVRKPLTTGLALTILVFSPLFDIANNYLIYATQSINDFRAFSDLTSSASSHFVGISLLTITGMATALVVWQGKNYPRELTDATTDVADETTK